MMKKRRKHRAEKTSRKADGSMVSVNPPCAKNELRQQCAAGTTAVHQHVVQTAQGTELAGVVLKWGFFLFSAEIKWKSGTAIFCDRNLDNRRPK